VLPDALGVSRNTVLEACALLSAEGYRDARVGARTFVTLAWAWAVGHSSPACGTARHPPPEAR